MRGRGVIRTVCRFCQ